MYAEWTVTDMLELNWLFLEERERSATLSNPATSELLDLHPSFFFFSFFPLFFFFFLFINTWLRSKVASFSCSIKPLFWNPWKVGFGMSVLMYMHWRAYLICFCKVVWVIGHWKCHFIFYRFWHLVQKWRSHSQVCGFNLIHFNKDPGLLF